MLPKGLSDGSVAQQGEELFGQLDGSRRGGGGCAGQEEKGLDGLMGQRGEEGVRRINGWIVGRGVWSDRWFNSLTPRLDKSMV